MNNEKEFKDLPEGWKWVRLGEIANLVKDISPEGSKPYLEIGDIDIHSKNYIIKEKESPNHCIKAKRGNIVISKVRPTRGAISLIKEAFLYVSPAFSVLEADNSTFLFYSLSRRQFFNYLGTLETGTTYPSVNDKDVMNYELPLPPLPEQQKIAEILETVDNTIEKTEKIIEKYKRIKQGLMQDLLTKGIDENGNIRDEKTHRFKDSPLGRIPEEWEVVRLGEVGEIITGSTPPTENSEYYGDEYLFISPEDIQNKKYIENTTKKLTKLGMNIQRKISPMSICVVCIGSTIGKIAITKYECSTNQQINTIIPNLKLYDPEALYYFINFHIQSPLKIEAGLQAVPIVNKSAFSKIPLPLPPLPEQQRIAEILTQIDQTIEKEQQYKEKLQKIKQGLMQDLLTGKVRVNNLVEEKENEQRYTNNFTRA